MNIQDFSERTGISKSALRYYETKNLLTPKERSANGYRIYSDDQIATVKLISSLRLADIPIKDIQIYLLENDETRRKQMMENWIKNINKKRDLLSVSLRYLESDSIKKEIYLAEKSPEQIIWYDAESKIGEFKQHFLDRGNELKKLNNLTNLFQFFSLFGSAICFFPISIKSSSVYLPENLLIKSMNSFEKLCFI